jgi:cytochrome c-type biogenesis protein
VEEFVTQTLPKIIGELSALAYLLVFLGGVLTSLGPCNLSMIPVIIGYVGGQQELTKGKGFWLALFFTLGSSATFMLLGVAAATVGGLFGTEQKLLYWLVALVCFVIGLKLLGVVKFDFNFLSRLQPRQVKRTGFLGAFLLGLIMGLAGSQCGTPVLVAILGIAMAKGTLLFGATLLFAYGLGRGVPIVLAGAFTGVIKALPQMARGQRILEKAAGIIILAVGLYFIWTA